MMGFYKLTKEERVERVEQISAGILLDFRGETSSRIMEYFSDEDTYIRKSAYQAAGRIYREHKSLQKKIIRQLDVLLNEDDFRIRQSVVNAAGEIGMKTFEPVVHFFDKGLFDAHPSVRNAVIGSVKKTCEKNPGPVLEWAKKYLHYPDKEIRREICHGIECRGRTHPGDILPLLKELQNDKTARVKNTLVHVLGQISYKKGCLAVVVKDLETWENKELVEKAIKEIIDVHERYKHFAALTQEEVRKYIEENLCPKE
jgi:3-methyladenine DNA glycosylase AlkC